MRLFIIVLVFILKGSFLYATEPSFKLTFGGKLGEVPIEINKMSQSIKTVGAIKINSWTLSPNFSSLVSNKKSLNLLEGKNFEQSLYIKIKFKF